MTPADKRMTELLDRWLQSLELHLKYAELDDTAYFAVQPWPAHDRPNRWIIELARQKTLDLKQQLTSRISMGDGKFADALELMTFLANLVGSQHIQRFIPLAEPEKQKSSVPDAAAQAAGAPAPVAAKAAAADTTREMPQLSAASRTQKPAPARPAKASSSPARPSKTEVKIDLGPALQKKVIADAVRLLKWGKKWHELPDLIARIAERPGAGDIRRILRENKANIESKAGTG